jgi:hypothetical protein
MISNGKELEILLKKGMLEGRVDKDKYGTSHGSSRWNATSITYSLPNATKKHSLYCK